MKPAGHRTESVVVLVVGVTTFFGPLIPPPTEVHSKKTVGNETELPDILLLIFASFFLHHGNSVHCLFECTWVDKSYRVVNNNKAFFPKIQRRCSMNGSRSCFPSSPSSSSYFAAASGLHFRNVSLLPRCPVLAHKLHLRSERRWGEKKVLQLFVSHNRFFSLIFPFRRHGCAELHRRLLPRRHLGRAAQRRGNGMVINNIKNTDSLIIN